MKILARGGSGMVWYLDLDLGLLIGQEGAFSTGSLTLTASEPARMSPSILVHYDLLHDSVIFVILIPKA